jgi:hypothetical protein
VDCQPVTRYGVQARGVLKEELQQHLRTQRCFRQSRLSSTRGQRRGQIVDGISIRERPAEIEDRAVPGHWEGDLIAGFADSYIATLVAYELNLVGDIMAIPIPASIWLFGSGVIGLIGVARRKKS